MNAVDNDALLETVMATMESFDTVLMGKY